MDAHVSRLRRKIGAGCVVAVPGYGYRAAAVELVGAGEAGHLPGQPPAPAWEGDVEGLPLPAAADAHCPHCGGALRLAVSA